MLEEKIEQLIGALDRNTEAVMGAKASETSVDMAEERVTGKGKGRAKNTGKGKGKAGKKEAVVKVADIKKQAKEICEGAKDHKGTLAKIKAQITVVADTVYQDDKTPLDKFDEAGLTAMKLWLDAFDPDADVEDEDDASDDLEL